MSVWAPVFPNMISDTPTNARPTSMMKIPVHITLRIVDPRNATDKRAVKMMTAPNKDDISLGKIQRWSRKCSKEDNRRWHTASDSNTCIIFNNYDIEAANTGHWTSENSPPSSINPVYGVILLCLMSKKYKTAR